MKKLVTTAAIMAGAIAFFAGCASTKSRDERASELEQFRKNRPAPIVIKTENKELQNTAGLSANFYQFMSKSLDDYYGFTDNQREYIGYLEEIADVMKSENKTEAEAVQKVMKDILEADKDKAGDKKVALLPNSDIFIKLF